MSPVHTDPWDAVCLHKDIQSKHSIGMHWGTYHLSDEPVHEPPVLLKEARKLENVTEAEFGVVKLGESITV